MNTVITLVAIAFLGQAEPLKTYPAAPGAYAQCKADAQGLQKSQTKLPKEGQVKYDCRIAWVQGQDNLVHIFQVDGKGFGPELADGKKPKKEKSSHWDQQCIDVIENPNMMVPWYLMASYAYYEEDDPILSDGLFDGLAKRMLESWDTIEHWHKDLITKEDLEAGTLLNRNYPPRVINAVKSLRQVKQKSDKHLTQGVIQRWPPHHLTMCP